jgi:hypothetical protein
LGADTNLEFIEGTLMAKGKHPILKTQANEIFAAIRELHLDPAEFQWVERDSVANPAILTVSALVHQPTGFYYVFDFKDDKHFSECSPGENSFLQRRYPGTGSINCNLRFLG